MQLCRQLLHRPTELQGVDVCLFLVINFKVESYLLKSINKGDGDDV
jgi:hypothetical protein